MAFFPGKKIDFGIFLFALERTDEAMDMRDMREWGEIESEYDARVINR